MMGIKLLLCCIPVHINISLLLFRWFSVIIYVESYVSPFLRTKHVSTSKTTKCNNNKDYNNNIRCHQIISRNELNFFHLMCYQDHNENEEGIYSICSLDRTMDDYNHDEDIVDDLFENDVTFFVGTKRGKWMSFLIDNVGSNPKNYNEQEKFSPNQLPVIRNSENDNQQKHIIYRKRMLSKPEESIHNQDWKPYPIYSMMLWSEANDCNNQEIQEEITRQNNSTMTNAIMKNNRTLYLGCGGGDRYLTIWGRGSINNDDNNNKGWQVIDKLGPHTGWVKDVVCDLKHERIYSIGCNCIESWGKQIAAASSSSTKKNNKRISGTGGSSPSKWKHLKKHVIESCPSTGATLSSDLLCLCLNDKLNSKYLFSGGVDGRIHVWATTTTMKSNQNNTDSRLPPLIPLHTVAAHNGRVNKIAVSKQANMIFSVGHDGTVQCRNLYDESKKEQSSFKSSNMIISEMPDCKLNFYELNGEKIDRVLTVTLLAEDENNALIAIGTASGNVSKINARRNKLNSLNMVLSNSVQLSDNSTIHTICKVDNILVDIDSTSRFEKEIGVSVGHSNGLSFFSL